MFERCYSGRYPSYENVKVCNDWHNYQVFAEWYSRDIIDKGKTYQLDKDLLGDSSVYSPETCCLLKDNINQMIIEASGGYVKRTAVGL